VLKKCCASREIIRLLQQQEGVSRSKYLIKVLDQKEENRTAVIKNIAR
jgi:hypothetical protein